MELTVHSASGTFLEDSDSARTKASEPAVQERPAALVPPSAAQSLAFLQVF